MRLLLPPPLPVPLLLLSEDFESPNGGVSRNSTGYGRVFGAAWLNCCCDAEPAPAAACGCSCLIPVSPNIADTACCCEPFSVALLLLDALCCSELSCIGVDTEAEADSASAAVL